jgi:inner membrane protein
MASAFSHAFVALALGKVPRQSSFTWRTLCLGMVCSVVPDLDVGVAFFSPLDTTRYFFRVRPIAVSPIGISGFFSEGAFRVLASEAQWIWLPVAAAFLVLRTLQGIYSSRERRSGR